MNLISSKRSAHAEQSESIYIMREKCFKKLIEIQKNLSSADEQYVNVSTKEGKPHENAWNRMEAYTAQYKKEYELCEKTMKPH
jgi:alpha-D-ribose 1-methylphosphonate 5-triphosphate diphosphatase PhnM